MDDVLTRLNNILKVPSVTKYELPLRTHLINRLEQIGLKVQEEVNCFGVIGQSNLLLAIHIDRLGLIKTTRGWEYSNFCLRKNRSSEKINKELQDLILKRYIGEGLQAYTPSGKLLGSGKVNAATPIKGSNKILFSVSNLNNIKEGTPARFIPPKNDLRGQLDNSITIACILELLTKQSKASILFTTQEEIGNSWYQIRDFAKKHKKGAVLILDTTTCEHKSDFLDGGVVIRKNDHLSEYDPALVKFLTSICKEKSIPYKMLSKNKDKTIIRSTEVGTLMTKTNLKAASLQIPTLYNHTNKEETSKKALKNYYTILKVLMQ